MSRTKPQSANVAQQQKSSPTKTTKQEKLIGLLRRKEGASIAVIARALGWQPHTVHGVISGTIRKRLGLNVVGTAGERGVRIYRIGPAN
jgi:hypothetical protein